MSKRITITCPACSATLAAPVSAIGKTLLCPKCRTGIPVQKSAKRTPASFEQQAGHAHNRKHEVTDSKVATCRQKLSKKERLFLLLTFGVSALLAIALLIHWSTEQDRTSRPAEVRDQALQDDDFDQVPNLDIDAMIARVQKQLEPPKTNVEGADRDLADLKRLVPDHPIHVDILPALSIARSMEYAEAGRIADVLQELEKATTLGVAEPQLLPVKTTLVDALLKQAEANLRNEHYPQVLADCDEILKLGGLMLQVTPLASKALAELSAQAKTADQLDEVLQAVEFLPESQRSAGVVENLRQVHFRRSQLALPAGDLDSAANHFLKLPEHGPLDSDMLQFGEELTKSTIAAYHKEHSAQNLQRAIRITILLDDAAVDSEQFLLLKIALSNDIVSGNNPDDIDNNLDYSIRSLQLARSKQMNLDRHQSLIRTLALALADRSIERLQQDQIQECYDDFLTANGLYPGLKRPLLARVRKITRITREKLPPGLRDELLSGEQDDIWKVIPAQATAFSVIRDLASYSSKVDHVAEVLNFAAFRLLEKGCELCRIHDGLNRNGSLGWVKMPGDIAGDNKKEEMQDFFLLATTDFLKMIHELEPTHDGSRWKVNMIDDRGVKRRGLAAPQGSFGAFAFEEDRTTLAKALSNDPDIQAEMVSFSGWVADLDAYFVLTHQGLIRGLQEYDIPFPTALLKSLLSVIRGSVFGSHALIAQRYPALFRSVEQLVVGLNAPPLHEWVQQLAVGLSIDPGYGIAVRSRLWLNPETNLTEVFAENPGGRELALKDLPDEPFVFAIGGPISGSQSQWISSLPEQLSPPQKKLAIRISRIQTVLLASDSIQADAEDPKNENGETAFWPGFDGGLILVVTVDDPNALLTELESLCSVFAALAPQADEIPRPAISVVSSEPGKLDDGTNVLRIQLNWGQYSRMLRIASPNREALVFALGGDKQMTRALAPFRGNANLSRSQTVRTGVRMLPDSTSWMAVADSRYLWTLAMGFLMGGGDEVASLIADSPMPVALGLSWQQSDLDIDVSVPWETMPFFTFASSIFQFNK